jgi:hypothetical protein
MEHEFPQKIYTKTNPEKDGANKAIERKYKTKNIFSQTSFSTFHFLCIYREILLTTNINIYYV